MANPQAENGHLDIANEIADAFCRLTLNGEEWKTLWVILRKTYGWHKKQDKISLSQFCLMTGLRKPHLCRALSNLITKKIITKSGNAKNTTYIFNKDFDNWIYVTKIGKKPTIVTESGKESVLNANKTTIKEDGKFLPKSATNQKITESGKKKLPNLVTEITRSGNFLLCNPIPSNSLQTPKTTITKETITKENNIKEKEKSQQLDLNKFPFLGDIVFQQTYRDYLDMRIKKKKPATVRAEELVLMTLHKYSKETAIKMIEQSIRNSWTDVYEIRQSDKKDNLDFDKAYQMLWDSVQETGQIDRKNEDGAYLKAKKIVFGFDKDRNEFGISDEEREKRKKVHNLLFFEARKNGRIKINKGE